MNTTDQPGAGRLRRSGEDRMLAGVLLIPADGADQSIAAAWLAGRRDRFR